MIRPRITPGRLYDIFRRSIGAIVGFALLFGVGGYLFMDMTRPEFDKSKTLAIYFPGGSGDGNIFAMEEIAQQMQADLGFESVTFSFVGIDATTWETFMAIVGSQEGDVFLMPKGVFHNWVPDNIFLPLDDYIASGVINIKDIDTSATQYAVPVGENGSLEVRTIGIPLVSFLNLEKKISMVGDYYYLCIMSYSQNPDGAARAIDWFIENAR